MNYVTSLFSSFKGYYDGINGATLTGAVDVIIVRQPDGTFACSPFHVRFGKLNVLHSTEKLVDITVNGNPVNLQMKLGNNGEAFFVKLCDEDDEYPLSNMLSTSPIQTDGGDLMRQAIERMRQQEPYITTDEDTDSLISDDSEYQEEEDYNPYDREDCLSDSELLIHHHTQHQIDNNNRVVWNWGTLPHQTGLDHQQVTSADEEGTSFMRGMWEYIGRTGRKRKNTFSGTIDMQEGLFLDDIDTADPATVSHYFGINHTVRSSRRTRQLAEEEAEQLARNDEKFRQLDALSLEAPRYISNNAIGPHDGSGTRCSTQTQTRTGSKRNKRTQTLDDLYCDSEVYLSRCGERFEQFFDYIVTYEQISHDPSILSDANLTVKFGDDYFNWHEAPVNVLCALAFKECRSIVEPDAEDRTRAGTCGSANLDDTFDDEDRRPQYKKTVRLTTEDIEGLELKDGPNHITFSVTTSYQGTTKCVCTIYLWDHNDRIVISDIDGTITRSDVFGHILPWVGKDWTQSNIAKLFTVLRNNGYKFLYLSSRAIGQASMTKSFLRTIKQNGLGIPEGPMLLSPDSLLRAIKDEVVLRQPHIFKIQCLTDISNLFGENNNPFYAGFGNRISDSRSYQAVNIPKNRIFIINHRGEIYTENSLVQQCTYAEIFDNNEVYFPPVHASHGGHGSDAVQDEYLAQNFWRPAILEFDESELVL